MSPLPLLLLLSAAAMAPSRNGGVEGSGGALCGAAPEPPPPAPACCTPRATGGGGGRGVPGLRKQRRATLSEDSGQQDKERDEKEMTKQRMQVMSAALLKHAEVQWDDAGRGIRLPSVSFSEAVLRATVVVTVPPPLNRTAGLSDDLVTPKARQDLFKTFLKSWGVKETPYNRKLILIGMGNVHAFDRTAKVIWFLFFLCKLHVMCAHGCRRCWQTISCSSPLSTREATRPTSQGT